MSETVASERARLLAGLREQIGRRARGTVATAVDGVLLSAEDHAGEPSPARSGAMLALIVQGAKRVALGERTYDYGAGQYLIAAVDLPITGHYTEASPDRPALGFGL